MDKVLDTNGGQASKSGGFSEQRKIASKQVKVKSFLEEKHYLQGREGLESGTSGGLAISHSYAFPAASELHLGKQSQELSLKTRVGRSPDLISS